MQTLLKRNEKVFTETKCEPKIIKTKGGLQILLLSPADLHKNNRDMPTQNISDASAFHHHCHPQYYYSDMVLYNGGHLTKIVKGNAGFSGLYLHSNTLGEFIDTLNHQSINKQTFN